MSRIILCRLGEGIVTASRFRASSQTTSLAQYYANDHATTTTTTTSISSAKQSPSSQCKSLLWFNSVRGMYSEKSLRMDTLDMLRLDKTRVFDSGKSRYIERVKNYIEQGQLRSVVKDDLINIIGLAETEEHLDLIEEMISSETMKSLMIDGAWGSVLMRLYYRMNQIERACINIKDTERFGDFFLQYAAFRILMTMLYNAGMHEEVLDIYNLACDRMPQRNARRQRQLDVLALASCAKLNNPERLSLAESIYKKSDSLDQRHLKSRMDSLLAHMAINLDEPAKALNYLTGTKLRSIIYMPFVTLKTLALMKLNRYEDVVYSLRESLQSAQPYRRLVTQEIVGMIEANMDGIEDENLRTELRDIISELKENNLILDASLESIIFSEIDTREGAGSQQSTRPGGRPFEARLDGLERTFDRQERGFDRRERNFDGQQRRFDGQERRFDGQERRFDGQERRFERRERKFEGRGRRFEDPEGGEFDDLERRFESEGSASGQSRRRPRERKYEDGADY